jgi:hypothetical protein
MLPSRPWVLGLGYAGAVFAAAHAYAFRVILGAQDDPDDMGELLTYFASNRTLFLVWVFAAIALWIVLVSLLPAIWRALGRGWAATAAVAAMFLGAVINIAGDGSQFPTIFLSARYARADESIRAGLEAAAGEVSDAVGALLGVGIAPLFVGLLAAALVSALLRPPGGRWYGSLFVLFGLANVPVGPPLVGAALNLLIFASIAYLTARALAAEPHT